MAYNNDDTASTVNPNCGGFCPKTKIYHSLRPIIPLPPQTTPLSLIDYIFSRLQASPPLPSTPALIDASTGHHILYPEFTHRFKTLAASLQTKLGLVRGDSVFILSPNSHYLPILFYSLLSLGVVVSPSNPASTNREISRQIQLCKPVLAFATSETVDKIPSLRYGTILLDSSEFESMMINGTDKEFRRVDVNQSDTATILYSSGTTGPVKGVELTHRNWISVFASIFAVTQANKSSHTVSLCTVPYFHVYGLGYILRVLSMGQTLVSMGIGRFSLRQMLRTIEEFRVKHVALAPPLVVVILRDESVLDDFDLSSLEVVACGGAPLRRSVIEKFRNRLPQVQLLQAYGLTETTGRVFGAAGLEEGRVEGATGKLMSNSQAKIVDPESGTSLPPLMAGELWIKGPTIMKGYVGDEEATASILHSEGWLKTGDLCYIDNEGYLFFVDRLKELIKYKGYQVAPAELEHLLQSHPDIIEAAVIPYPDEEAGQVPLAFVVKRIGSFINESQIMDLIAKQVAPYKRIRQLKFIDSLPKNVGGKVLRRELIKLALSNQASKL